jgi:hypothetical protein
VHPLLGVDPINGGQWAAWNTATDDVVIATSTATGWSEPAPALQEAELTRLAVSDGVVQLLANKSGLTYATNASGSFMEQLIDPATDHFWGDTAFALLPSGRPIVVIARDEPVASRSGLWIQKGPPPA